MVTLELEVEAPVMQYLFLNHVRSWGVGVGHRQSRGNLWVVEVAICRIYRLCLGAEAVFDYRPTPTPHSWGETVNRKGGGRR